MTGMGKVLDIYKGAYRVSQVLYISLQTCHVPRPRQTLLESHHMRFFCIGFRCENDVAICINLYLRGCIVHFRKYGLPYGLSVSLCTLHLMVTHFDATLGMGGWLDLTQQGLSPCKKYRAFLALL